MPTELFFPRRGETTKLKEAKKVCSTCPVTRECLEAALAYEEEGIAHGRRHGVWGGLSGKSRSVLVSNRIKHNNSNQKSL